MRKPSLLSRTAGRNRIPWTVSPCSLVASGRDGMTVEHLPSSAAAQNARCMHARCLSTPVILGGVTLGFGSLSALFPSLIWQVSLLNPIPARVKSKHWRHSGWTEAGVRLWHVTVRKGLVAPSTTLYQCMQLLSRRCVARACMMRMLVRCVALRVY